MSYQKRPAQKQPQQSIPFQPLNNLTYVDQAEKLLKSYADNPPTNSQLRNVASKITEIYDQVILLQSNDIPEDLLGKIAYVRVHIVYASARDPKLKTFVEKSHLLSHLKDVCDHPSKEKYILFTHYVEALIAYHAFYKEGK